MFGNVKDNTKRYAFLESEEGGIVGILYSNGKENVKKFKNESEIKRKRSALVSSPDWRLIVEEDRDTGLKLPIYMYPPWDTNVRWVVQWMENDNYQQRGGIRKVIMSSFIKTDAKDEEPHTKYLRNMSEVKEQYDLLKINGWIEAVQPKIDVKYAAPESEEKKEKRNKEQALQSRLMDMLETERKERGIHEEIS